MYVYMYTYIYIFYKQWWRFAFCSSELPQVPLSLPLERSRAIARAQQSVGR